MMEGITRLNQSIMKDTALMTRTATLSPLKPSTNHEMRNKFLNMIGIESKLPPTTSTSMSHSDKLNQEYHPRTKHVTSYTESLKYDRRADERYATKRRKTELQAKATRMSSSCKPKKKCGFNDTVTVVPIPMRTEYSNRVKSRLWSNAIEIHENATRNTIEFAAEGWDWRTVVEDERMYVCVATGELVHPIHHDLDLSTEKISR